MPNYAPRISLPYQHLAKVLDAWAESCEKFIVYEHPQDDRVKTTHIHVLMINSSYKTPEQYKRKLYDLLYPNVSDSERPKGNEFWKWATKSPPDESFIIYMSKGNLLPVLSKNFSEAYVEDQRRKWIAPTSVALPANTKNPKQPSKTHFEICEDIRAEYDSWRIPALRAAYKERTGHEPSVGRIASLTPEDMVAYLARANHKQELQRIVNKHLQLHKIRTSRNELERFVVTVVRDHEDFQNSVWDSIWKNVLRSII